MKKWLCFLGTLICFLSCTSFVKADVIWQPMDSFYVENESKCTYVGRSFTANGPDSVVILYESPKSPKVVTTWENGFQAYISFTYEDENGVLWGIYDDFTQSGWMPMEYMELIYDHISFFEDYGEEIIEQRGSLEEQYRGECVYFWKYPGSKEGYSYSMMQHDLPTYNGVYTDEKGHSWGYIGYYYGSRDNWICIDQPTADYEQLYPDGGPQIGTVKEEGETQSQSPEGQSQNLEGQPQSPEEQSQSLERQDAERIVPQPENRTIVVLAVLVGLVVLVTVVLLVILKRGKQEEETSCERKP